MLLGVLVREVLTELDRTPVVLILNTIIQLAWRHYGWWRNAKKRNETFFVSMRNDIMVWAPSVVLI